MMALRFVSGMFEAVSDPCFVAMTGMWFTRRQQPTVIGLWYMANGVGIACGGLIGYGIGHIKGNLPSWSYEFLIIGYVFSLFVLFFPSISLPRTYTVLILFSESPAVSGPS